MIRPVRSRGGWGVALAAAGVGLAWWALGSPEPRDRAPTAASTSASPAREASQRVAEAEILADDGAARREVPVPDLHLPAARTLQGPEPVTAPGHVRVHGLVRRAGLPVADYDLAFLPVEALRNPPDPAGDDWDVTTADGRYGVELHPGRYAVLNDDEGTWLTDLAVPAGELELTLDIDLFRSDLAR